MIVVVRHGAYASACPLHIALDNESHFQLARARGTCCARSGSLRTSGTRASTGPRRDKRNLYVRGAYCADLPLACCALGITSRLRQSVDAWIEARARAAGALACARRGRAHGTRRGAQRRRRITVAADAGPLRRCLRRRRLEAEARAEQVAGQCRMRTGASSYGGPPWAGPWTADEPLMPLDLARPGR